MEDMLDFCLRYFWVYNCKMTELFVDKPWTNMPHEWLEVFNSMSINDLRRLVNFEPGDNWPGSLHEFSRAAYELSHRYDTHWTAHPKIDVNTGPVGIPHPIQLGMSEKKRHEISIMAPLVQSVCVQTDCQLVVDIGCGLGYLGQTLNQIYDSEVLGFESKGSNCQSVRKSDSNIAGIITKQLMIDDSAECTEAISQEIHECLLTTTNASTVRVKQETKTPSVQSKGGVCLVGLHCCGDLTPSTLRQFCRLRECQTLVCMSCCYHRLSCDENGQFANFPLSEKFTDIYRRLTAEHVLKINSLALRLACQETKARWLIKSENEILEHSKHVAYRAVLEHFCQKSGSNLSKKHKKLAGLDAFTSFPAYIDAILSRMTGFSENDADSVRNGLMESYLECEQLIPIVRWYNVLQVMMQAVLESLILHDRQQFLIEEGISTQLVSTFDDVISPRNIAIVAIKQ